LRQLPCSKQARAESYDQHGRKSTKSIDKTAKSIGAFDSINHGVYSLRLVPVGTTSAAAITLR